MDESLIQGTSTAASRGVRLRGGDHDESSIRSRLCVRFLLLARGAAAQSAVAGNVTDATCAVCPV